MPVRQEAVEEVYEEQTPAPRVRATPTSSRRMAPAVQGEVVEQVGDPEQADWVQPNGDYYGGGFGEGCYGGNCGGCGGGCGSFGACDGCGGYFNGFCNHGCLGNFYGDIDYLMWWTKGMDTPPLVVQVNNGQGDVIYGNDPLLTGLRNGGRVRLGKWFDCCQTTAIEGDYQFLDTIKDTFTAASTGIPQIGRPFIDANTGAQFIEEVATAGRLAGSVRVDSQGQYRSAGIRLRRQLCCEPICYTDWHTGCQMQGNARTDVILGYRYARLGESLNIHESLVALDPANPGTFEIDDSFGTENDFHGAEIGVTWQNQRGRWVTDFTLKTAIGNVHEVVRINGRTVTAGANNAADNGVRPGGLLTQTTNIGTYQRDEFAVIPEAALNLGYQLTPRVRIQAGYTFIYWSRVARPGDQIDLTVNTNLLPERQFPLVNPVFAGAARPAFTFRDSDFWAQGINVGLHIDF